MPDFIPKYTQDDALSFLLVIKNEQEKIYGKMSYLMSEYSNLHKIWSANNMVIEAMEEKYGTKTNKSIPVASFEELQNFNGNTNSLINYDLKDTIADKAAFALRNARAELTTNEILNFLYSYDEDLANANHRENMSKFSATLIQKLNKEETFYRVEMKDKSFVWGLQEWRNWDFKKSLKDIEL